MSDQPIRLANPGNPDAQKALRKDEHGRKPGKPDPMSALYCFFSAGVAWIAIPAPLKYIFAGISAVTCAALGLLTLWGRRRQHTYDKYVAAGDILTLDPHLVSTWDDLFADTGLKIDCCQRREQLGGLFYAARDLAPELAKRTQALQQHDPDAELLADARIRVRLLQEMAPIRVRLTAQIETQEQIAALAPDWADASEVAEQLEVLRERRTTHPAEGEHPPAPAT